MQKLSRYLGLWPKIQQTAVFLSMPAKRKLQSPKISELPPLRNTFQGQMIKTECHLEIHFISGHLKHNVNKMLESMQCLALFTNLYNPI